MMRRMPKLHKNNENFFRGLGSKGIISFSEYLFLLTILIKPQSGFNMDRLYKTTKNKNHWKAGATHNKNIWRGSGI